MADDKQSPQAQTPAEPSYPHPQPAPVQRAGISGMTQVITASIGAIATISGALIAATWNHGGSHETVRPTAVPTVQQAQGDEGVFPPGGNSGGGGSNGSNGGEVATGDAASMLGQWRGAGAPAAFVIVQNEDGSVTVNGQAQTPDGMYQTSGRGQISGNSVSWSFQDNGGGSGDCQATMSADGHQLAGGCRGANGVTAGVALVR